ncbi:C6 zinc finger domain-containing protein [Verticillium dahliae]|nr:C6 zinc finger domain-containing protein [Verticillium dahliae]
MTRKKRACDSCHRRKIQCDGVLPQCNFCFHNGVTCTFSRILGARKRTPKPSGNSDKDLARRIERIELALDAAQKNLAARILESREADGSETTSPSASSYHPNGQTGDSATASNNATTPDGHKNTGEGLSPATTARKARSAGRPKSSNFGTLHFAGFHVGEISSCNGIPFFSPNGQNWIRSRTGQDPTFEKLLATGPPWHSTKENHAPLRPDDNVCATTWELPDKALVESCVRAYCSSSFGHAFPIVEPEEFQTTLDLAYEDEGSPLTIEATSAKACLFAFMTYVHHSRMEHVGEIGIDGQLYMSKAWQLIPQIMHQVDVPSFQTLFMLCMSSMFMGDFQRGSVVHALACRVLFMLGGHAQPSQRSTTNNAVYRAERNKWLESHLRQMFWMTYTLDKEVSVRTGLPPSIEDDYCDLTLPQAHRDPQLMVREGAGSLSDTNSTRRAWLGTFPTTLPGDLTLTIIKSKTYRALYSTAALRKSDAELLRDIRELDEELERWRCSVPQPFRPALAFSEDAASSIDKDMDRHIIMKKSIIHFEYHYLSAAIHRASGRCSVWAGGEGVSSSVAITVQASRSTLIYLRAAADGITETAFWYEMAQGLVLDRSLHVLTCSRLVVFYPMSATLTLFCNILLDPCDAQAEDDLDLLCTIPSLIMSIKKSPLTAKEQAYFQEVNEFFAELTRLARCAIDRISPMRDTEAAMELD